MGEHSKIEWTDHTFNPWRGCTKVASGCANCYADTLSKRNPSTLGIWGPNGTRVVASESMWKQPVKWNSDADARQQWYSTHMSVDPPRPRVFCASLADVFEDWQGPIHDASGETMYSLGDLPVWQSAGSVNLRAFPGFDTANPCFHTTIKDVRERLFRVVDATSNLDWLMLTKRPQNIRAMWPATLDYGVTSDPDPARNCRPNVWLGTSIACKDDLPNIEHLKACRELAPVLFLSIEPLLEDLGKLDLDGINWVIVGGESGPHARPMHLDWVRSIRDQCQAASVPFFFKQHGEWLDAATVLQRNLHGTHVEYVGPDKMAVRKVGKKAAGRLLDGREWNEFPEVNR